MKFGIGGFFENLLRKFKFHQNRTRITGALREAHCTFFIMSRSCLLRMRNVADKRRENQNTNFVFSIIFFILQFTRKCGIIL